MIVTQANATYKQVVPDVNHVLSGLTVMFCRTVDDVNNAHTLTVQPDQYATAMRRRILVCPTFANVVLDEEAVARDLPTDGVPPAFIENAVPMPSAATLRTTMIETASRHSQFGPNPEEDANQDEDEDGAAISSVSDDASKNVETISCHADRTNDFETVIGIDTASEEPAVHLFETMQSKLELLVSEANKIAKAGPPSDEAQMAQVAAK